MRPLYPVILGNVGTEADVVVASILHADDDFLIEVGRLTLLFARVEDALAQGAIQLAELAFNGEPQTQAEQQKVMHLRLLDKRNLLKARVAEAGRFYDVDCTRVLQILDDLGNLNKLRRTIIHGFVRWSSCDKRPVFLDSHGSTASAWPWDVLDVNQKVLAWFLDYCNELHGFLRAVMEAIDHFAERLLNRRKRDLRDFLPSPKV